MARAEKKRGSTVTTLRGTMVFYRSGCVSLRRASLRPKRL
jgi:hypothetical protein